MSTQDIPLPGSDAGSAAAAAYDPARALDATLNEAPVERLRDAVAGGDLAAMSQLGDRLMVGRNAPFSPDEGVALVRRAAEGGHLEALNRLATLSAAGAWTPQSWDESFRLLVAAAEGGLASARGQLLMLAQDPALVERVRAGETAPGVWRRLADSFTLEPWITAPSRRPVCEKPRIRLVDGFISPEICAWLIDRARGRLHKGLMYNGRDSVVMDVRDCSEFVFDIVESDVVSLLVRVKISAVTKLPTIAMEPTQIFHYALGQQIKAHYDHVRDDQSGVARSDSAAERIATVLVYLNDDYDGGDLVFSKIDFKFRGRTGDAIYFANVDEAGKAERLSLHAALPILRGEKWMLSQWIQDRPTYAG